MSTETSVLYARGIIPLFTGNPGSGSEGDVNNLGIDSSRFSSLVLDGAATCYICGYGSVFMNGQFTSGSTTSIVGGQGWAGDFHSKAYNRIGFLRHFLTQARYNSNTAEGTSYLVISDGASISDQTNYGNWGQFVSYMRVSELDVLPHMYSDIVGGAYGYDSNEHYFHQFCGVILLLSAGNQTFSGTFCDNLREAIKRGVSVIAIQKGPGAGAANFNAIFSPLGIQNESSGYVSATANGVSRSKATYSDHISWTNVERLHNQENYRSSAGFRITSGQSDGPQTVNGQTGPWHKFFSQDVDRNDDVRVDVPVVIRDKPCTNEGDGYTVNFSVVARPQKPDNWQQAISDGILTLDVTSTIDQGLPGRSPIYCHVVGWGVDGSGREGPQTNPGYTIVNGTQYHDTRGLNVYKIRKSDRVLVDRRTFDIYGNAGNGTAEGQGSALGKAAAAACASYLNSIGSDFFVLVNGFDDMTYNRLEGGLPQAMYRIGASRRIFEGSKFYFRAAYNCFGSPGIGEGNAYNEMLKATMDTDPHALFDVGYAFDRNNNPYITGTLLATPVGMSIQGTTDNGIGRAMQYYKEIDVIDAGKVYGVQHHARLKDNRFKKLAMYDETDFVVSVENPCLPVPVVQSHDWVRVYHGAGKQQVNYPWTNLTEFLLITTDNAGPNELCTSHLMMNWEMFDGVGGAVAYNEAGPDHLTWCGGDRNNPSSLYFSASGGSQVWQIYQRTYNLVDSVPVRDSNDWQVHWKWNGVGTQGHNIHIDPGYEYIVFSYDRYGSLELAERHFIVPEANLLPKWGANLYNNDFSNSTLFEVNRSLECNARCTKSSSHGTENGIMMIIRRPMYMSTGPDDRTGWQLIYNDQGTSLPRGTNYPIPLEDNYQYMVLASCGNGAFSSHHFNGWHQVFETSGWDNGASVEAESAGRCEWSYDRQRLLVDPGKLSTNASSYLDDNVAPVGVYQVYRRPILSFDIEELM